MKKCPFCGEEIQDQATQCKQCGEFLDASRRPRPAEEMALGWNRLERRIAV